MKGWSESYSIDANVILRYLLRDDEAQYTKAEAIVKDVAKGAVSIHCDPVILGEVVWVLASFYKLPRRKIFEILAPMLKADEFRIPNKSRYIRALELYAHSIPHFGDACACATALEDCEGRLLSFDRELSDVQGIIRSETA